MRMYLKSACFISLLISVFVFGSYSSSIGCEGTPKPSCGRTMWFTILTPGNVAMPQNGQFQIQLVLVPYVFWNTANGCAQPNVTGNDKESRSSILLDVGIEIKCVSYTLGGEVDLGVQNFSLPVPVTPGLQTMNVNLVIPDGVLDRSDIYTAFLNGTATANFEGGFGSGMMSASTSAQAYLVPGVSDFPDIPRVNIEYLPLSDTDPGYIRCRRGDQALFHFLVSNNDMFNSVTLDLSTQIGQVAGLPDGLDPGDPQTNFNNRFYAISTIDGDYFNHMILSYPGMCPSLEEGDPHLNPNSLSDQVTLLAGEVRIMTIAVRSFGMCANGSCNKLTLRAEGIFSDGTDALACSSTALVVDDMPPKSTRCEIRDDIKTDFEAGVQFSYAMYYDDAFQPIPHATTNAFGNIPPSSSIMGWFLLGPGVSTDPGAFQNMSDFIRFDPMITLGGVFYHLQFSGMTGTAINDVTLIGLPEETGTSYALPVIRYIPGPVVNIRADFKADTLNIQSQFTGTTLYSGSLSSFLEQPPVDFVLELNCCRSFTKTQDLTTRELCTDTYSFATLHRGFKTPHRDFTVFDKSRATVSGTFNATGNFIDPPMQNFDEHIGFDFVKTNIPFAPERARAVIQVQSPGALAPLMIPVVASRMKIENRIITNEIELVNALKLVQVRRGSCQFEIQPEGGVLPLSDLSFDAGFFDGDGVIIEGLRSSPDNIVAVIDGSGCPPPCHVFRFEGDYNEISNVLLMNFPSDALTLSGHDNIVSSSVFQDNGGNGITVEQGLRNRIEDGSYVNNGGLGIDLDGDGVTANDPMDKDSSANLLQNYPVLTDASIDTSGGTYITGTLHSTSKTDFEIQFFTNTACDASGFGEGETYMESIQVMTDDQGDAAFTHTTSLESPMGTFITALATDPEGNTSEFSACMEVTGTTSILKPVSFFDIWVFPNPATDIIYCQLDLEYSTPVIVSLLDPFGRVVQNLCADVLDAGSHLFQTSSEGLPRGLYLCQVILGQQMHYDRISVQ